MEEKFAFAQNIMESLPGGALLTTEENGKTNTMTIAWGSIGHMWGKKIFIAMVRDSRFTKSAMDHTGEFTVTLPVRDELKATLAFCGSKSGRDYDKISECGLELLPSETVTPPAVKGTGVIIECKVVYQQRMERDLLCEEVAEKWYGDSDMHTMYYGEILNIKEI